MIKLKKNETHLIESCISMKVLIEYFPISLTSR